MRRFLAWILILHAFAHTFIGTWTSARAGAWPATFWTVATVGFLAAALGMLRLPFARRVWKLSFLVATAASMHLMVWYAPPFAIAGLAIDIVLFIVVLGVYQPRIDADITVVETLGTGAFRHPVWTRGSWTIGFAALAYVAIVLVARPVTLRWGTTPAERAAPLPGDQVHPATAYFRIDHAITIRAPADKVWPWLMQLGEDRGGFYSYDWLERMAGDDVHNADRVHPEWQQRRVGDTVFATQRDYLGGRFGGLGWRVNVLEPPRVIGLENWGTFVLQPVDSTTTRLIVRTRGPGTASVAAFVFAVVEVFAFEPAHFIMERGMLRGVRDRAEQVASSR